MQYIDVIISFKINIYNHKKTINTICFANSNDNMNVVDDSNKECSIFIFGLGYVGSALANTLKSKGWKVSGTCTNVKKDK